jgi:hypothetical protein
VIVTGALGFWLKISVVDRDDDIDNSSESDVIDNKPTFSAAEVLIDEDDDGHIVDDDEFEMVSISTLYY